MRHSAQVTSQQVWGVIPRRLTKYVQSVDIDSDGIWVYLNDKAIDTSSESHTVHSYTLMELRRDIKKVKITR